HLSTPLTPIPSPSRGEGGSCCCFRVIAETLPRATLLPLREKVAAKRSDEGCAASRPPPPSKFNPTAPARASLAPLGRGACGLSTRTTLPIQRLLERRVAQPPIGRDERLILAFPPRNIGIHQPLDGI